MARRKELVFASSLAWAASLIGACSVLDGLVVPLPATAGAEGGVLADGALIFGADGQSASDGATSVGEGGGLADADAGAEPDAKSLCPLNPCPGNEVCCFVKKSATSAAYRCMTACPGGTTPVECAGPQQCGTGTPLCCAKVFLGAGSFPSCPADNVSSACVSNCSANVGLGCNLTDTFRLCHEKADCASDSANPNCCTYPGTGLPAFICLSDLAVTAAGLTCSQ